MGRPFHAGVGGQLLDVGLGEAAELDAVVEAAEHARRVLDGLLLAHLGAAGVEVGHAHAEVHGADLERAAGAGGRLLEQQNDVLALEIAVRHTGVFHGLEAGRKIEQIADLLGTEIQQGEEAFPRKVHRHGTSPFKRMRNESTQAKRNAVDGRRG